MFMRKVFLDDLPRWGKSGKGKEGAINWKESVGYKVKFVYDDIEGEIEIVEYLKKDKLKIKYKNKIHSIVTYFFKKGTLGGALNKITKDFKIEIGERFKDEKRDLIILDREHRLKEGRPDKKGRVYTKNEKWYKYRCEKCTYEGWNLEANLDKGIGCSCCYGRTAVLGINTIWDTNRWMCDLGVSEEDAKRYTNNSGKKIEVTCPDCNKNKKIRISDIYKRKTINCVCSNDGFSYPEKFMYSILRQLKVKFETEYSPEYLKRKEAKGFSRKYSDFYIPTCNLVIEVDGGLGHNGGKLHGKSNKTLEELIETDKWKDEQHLKHGIKTIRIDCFESNVEYIKNSILNSELSDFFDLSKVNWLKCEEFAIKSNIVKEICEYWNNKSDDETTTDLVRLFNSNKTTIIRYLKIGNKFGWCDYFPEIEKKKIAVKNGYRNKQLYSKKVEISNKGISLGVFESAGELESISESLFGITLKRRSICSACNGKLKHYKGYTFKYIE